MICVEYDDGKPKKADKDRHPRCIARGRKRGFYLRLPNGSDRYLPIGYMRVSEMTTLEGMINEIYSDNLGTSSGGIDSGHSCNSGQDDLKSA